MKKFELTTEQKINWFGRTLYRIKACISFTTTDGFEVKAGDLGGWVEKERNLSHDGKAWVCGDAEVWGNAKVCGDAKVWGNAEVWGNAKVCGDAKVWGNAEVCGDANIFSTKHIFCVTPIGKYAISLTLFRTKNCEIKVSFSYEMYDLEEFRKMIHEEWDAEHVEIAEGAINLAKKHIDLTPEKKNIEPCPFCGGEAESFVSGFGTSFGVICTNCGVETALYKTEDEAIEVWGNRV